MRRCWRVALYVVAAVFALLGILVLAGVPGLGTSDTKVTLEDDLFSLGMS